MDILSQFLQLQEQTPIYNRYLNGDFSVGLDNLNPKREVQPDYASLVASLRVALFNKYKGQLTQGGGVSIAPSSLGIPYVDSTRISATIPLPIGFAPSATPVPLQQDMYTILGAISSFLQGTPVTLADLPFDICGDNPYLASSNGTTPPAGTSTATPAGANITTGLIGANATGSSTEPSLGSAQPSSDTECAMVELQLLQVVFQIIAFIQTFLGIEKRALSYIYPYVEIAEQAVACYLNPSMIPQMILSAAGQAQAAIYGLIMPMVAQLIANLNLECLLSEVMSAVQQILGSIAGVTDIGSELGSFVSFNANVIAGAEKLTGAVYSASQGNNAALYRELGIPPSAQSQASTLNAGALFNLASSTLLAPVSTLVGQAVGAAGALAGAATSTVQGAINGISTSANDIVGSAKLIKDYFPGGEFSTF
jgi:hypothetical protein